MVAACPFPSPQGSQVFVGGMCRGLVRRGHEVHLLTYGQGENVAIDGVTHERIRRLPGDDAMRSGPTVVKPLLDLLMVSRLATMARRRRFDVLHCHNYEGALVGTAVRMLTARSTDELPVVYHSHNMMSDELPSYFTGTLTKSVAARLGDVLDRTVPRSADHCIALCEHTAAELIRFGVGRQRLSVVPPAVDDPGPSGSRDDARRRLGLDPNSAIVTYAGNLDRYQNLSLLVGALRTVLDRTRHDLRLLVGAHHADASFDALVRAAGLESRVTMVLADDFKPVWRCIEAADVVVMPRRLGSGFPVKLVNYLAAGRAIVTAGCGAKAIRDGVDGVVVADDDPDALAAAIGAVLDARDLRERLEAEARRTYLSSFTWEAVLPAIEDVYERVTDPGSRGYRAYAV